MRRRCVIGGRRAKSDDGLKRHRVGSHVGEYMPGAASSPIWCVMMKWIDLAAFDVVVPLTMREHLAYHEQGSVHRSQDVEAGAPMFWRQNRVNHQN
jgi:hypothetical protein